MERARRPVTVVTAALLVVLLAATGIAADRLFGPRGESSVQAIAPSYTFLPVGGDAPAKAAPAKPEKVKKARQAAAPRPAQACPAAPRIPAQTAVAARAAHARVKVFDRPEGNLVRTLTNPTDEGKPLHALVHERRGSWLRIGLVARPNGATGWVRITAFSQYEVPYRIVVQRCSRKLTVFQQGRPIWQRSVAVGKASTPTPKGDFFVDFITEMRCCTYGPRMLSIAGFSNVIFQFGKGGTGQIAIHGTTADWSVGRAASNGCIRMHNADVLTLSEMVPAGTPVHIVD